MIIAVALQAAEGAVWAQFIPLLFMIAIVYFLFILPQRREQKKHQAMLAALKRGDQVVTAGGLVGDILHITDEIVTLKTGESRVVVERARIARLVRPNE